MGKIAFVAIAAVLVVALLIGATYFSYSNREIGLRNQIAAKQKSNEATFDKMWKVIQQSVGVKDDYKNSFKEVALGMMEARYSGDNTALAKWVQESNVTPDPSVFTKIMGTIESNREQFLSVQNALIDLNREHTDIITKVPGSWFMASRGIIEITVVTSSKTEAAFSTGKEEL